MNIQSMYKNLRIIRPDLADKLDKASNFEELRIVRQMFSQFHDQNKKPKRRIGYHYIINANQNTKEIYKNYVKKRKEASKNYQVLNAAKRIANYIESQKNNYAYNCNQRIY